MIGIHDRLGSFSDRWIVYCVENKIPFRTVDCLATDVVAECSGLDAMLWHWPHDDPTSVLVARSIIAALETSGLLVFPDIATCWHFDDKVAQKYLLEATGAPSVKTWVFTDSAAAMAWIEETTWPKVFKLRCGAGSSNVRLVRSPLEARSLCRRAFSSGFHAAPGLFTDMPNRVRSTRGMQDLWRRTIHLPSTIRRTLAARQGMRRERGYLYLQEFLPGNDFDTRITIIGNRAFGFTRQNRPGDFRASGGGSINYDQGKLDRRCIDIAFQVTGKLRAQSVAFDFLFNEDGEPLISEISYCYKASAVHDCPGHWDRSGKWEAGHMWPEDAIICDLLAASRSNPVVAERNHNSFL